MGRIIFVTGTDTGVGKTVLTASLLHHLRLCGIHALAMKPFCSGSRADVELLQSLQDRERSDREINPYYFREPVAPLVSVKKQRRHISFREILRRINLLAGQCDVLLVEGLGGVMVPLIVGRTLADVIARLNCDVVVVARNQLGTINHSLMTVKTLRAVGVRVNRIKIVLMNQQDEDVSARTNRSILSEWLSPVKIFAFPFFGGNPNKTKAVKLRRKKIKKTLACLTKVATVATRSLESVKPRRDKETAGTKTLLTVGVVETKKLPRIT